MERSLLLREKQPPRRRKKEDLPPRRAFFHSIAYFSGFFNREAAKSAHRKDQAPAGRRAPVFSAIAARRNCGARRAKPPFGRFDDRNGLSLAADAAAARDAAKAARRKRQAPTEAGACK
jgi:hypothetical protein